MIKVKRLDVDKTTEFGRVVDVFLVADTADEVKAIGNDGSTVVGLKANDVIALGSTCMIASGGFGTINSNGTWTFK